MKSLPRIALLLLVGAVTLAACATPTSIAPAPPFTPAPRALSEIVEAAPADRVELAAGHYQLIMFYSPL